MQGTTPSRRLPHRPPRTHSLRSCGKAPRLPHSGGSAPLRLLSLSDRSPRAGQEPGVPQLHQRRRRGGPGEGYVRGCASVCKLCPFHGDMLGCDVYVVQALRRWSRAPLQGLATRGCTARRLHRVLSARHQGMAKKRTLRRTLQHGCVPPPLPAGLRQRAHLRGSEPLRRLASRLSVCRAGKAPGAAHSSGRSPVKRLPLRSLRQGGGAAGREGAETEECRFGGGEPALQQGGRQRARPRGRACHPPLTIASTPGCSCGQDKGWRLRWRSQRLQALQLRELHEDGALCRLAGHEVKAGQLAAGERWGQEGGWQQARS